MTEAIPPGIPEIIRVLAEWEDANGSLAGIMYDEWIALYKPVTDAAVTDSPRMVRNRLTTPPASRPDEDAKRKQVFDVLKLAESWRAATLPDAADPPGTQLALRDLLREAVYQLAGIDCEKIDGGSQGSKG